MERVANLDNIVHEEVAGYVWDQDDTRAYILEDPARQVYAAVAVPIAASQKAMIAVMARVEGDKVIIETDHTDRPLFQELIRRGVPREQIVLAYQGETLPATS